MGDIDAFISEKGLAARAVLFARAKFGERLDRTGNLMVIHSERVGNRGKTEEQKAIGYLHDVLEDTEASESELRELFPLPVVDAVVALSRRSGETYEAFIARIALSGLAAIVKVNDLEENMARVHALPEKEARRLFDRYAVALSRLLEVCAPRSTCRSLVAKRARSGAASKARVAVS